MRLWSIHPKYLDSKGLTALWREALLAKKVLQGKTSSYKNHPQLDRFKKKPISFISKYLFYVYQEACNRGYCFDKRRIGRLMTRQKIKVSSGQIKHEFEHLKRKLKIRDRKRYNELLKIRKIEANPLFDVVKGKTEDWEKIN